MYGASCGAATGLEAMGVFVGGFQDEDHRRRFLEAAAKTRFGAAEAPICGAKIRTGGVCKKRPLVGEHRCLRHVGPAGARRYHERLYEALGRGEISPEEWQGREHRRRVNALPRVWAKNPWAPGATLILGDFEERFRADLVLGGINAEDLSPAAADRARWKWRRLMHDRKRPNEWAAFLTSDLAARIRRDGPRPAVSETEAAIDALFGVVAAPAPFSRRRRADLPRPPVAGQKRKRMIRRGESAIDDTTLQRVMLEHGRLIMRLVGDAADEKEIRWLAGLLARHLDDPDDAAAGEAWRRAVSESPPRR